jgi:hypothetical protein
VISGFRRYVDEIAALLGYYAALSGNSEPLSAALYSRRAQIYCNMFYRPLYALITTKLILATNE